MIWLWSLSKITPYLEINLAYYKAFNNKLRAELWPPWNISTPNSQSISPPCSPPSITDSLVFISQGWKTWRCEIRWMYGLISPTFLCVKVGAVNWPLKQMFKGHVLMEARATEISNCIHGHDKYLQIQKSFAIMCLGAGLWHWYFYKVQIYFFCFCFLACIYSVLWWLTMSLTPSDSRGKAEVYHSMFKAQNIRVQSCSALFFVASLSSQGLNRPYWLHFIFMVLCLPTVIEQITNFVKEICIW